MTQSIFGVLLHSVPSTLQFVPENLTKLAEIAESAKKDFKNAEWFVRLSKIRITDHVTYKSHDGQPHDKQVSGLIAAARRKDYNADAHRRFRTRYRELLSDRGRDPMGLCCVDPYTVRNHSQRQETIAVLAEGMKDHPEISRTIVSYLLSFAELSQKLASPPPNRKVQKKSQ